MHDIVYAYANVAEYVYDIVCAYVDVYALALLLIQHIMQFGN